MITVRSFACGFVAVSLALTGCGAQTEATPSGPDDDLTTIELGHRPTPDNATFKQIASMLDMLQATCVGNTRAQLADATVRIVTALDEKGVRVTPTKVLGDAVTGLGFFGKYPVDECRPMFEQLLQVYERGPDPTG